MYVKALFWEYICISMQLTSSEIEIWVILYFRHSKACNLHHIALSN